MCLANNKVHLNSKLVDIDKCTGSFVGLTDLCYQSYMCAPFRVDTYEKFLKSKILSKMSIKHHNMDTSLYKIEESE